MCQGKPQDVGSNFDPFQVGMPTFPLLKGCQGDQPNGGQGIVRLVTNCSSHGRFHM